MWWPVVDFCTAGTLCFLFTPLSFVVLLWFWRRARAYLPSAWNRESPVVDCLLWMSPWGCCSWRRCYKRSWRWRADKGPAPRSASGCSWARRRPSLSRPRLGTGGPVLAAGCSSEAQVQRHILHAGLLSVGTVVAAGAVGQNTVLLLGSRREVERCHIWLWTTVFIIMFWRGSVVILRKGRG